MMRRNLCEILQYNLSNEGYYILRIAHSAEEHWSGRLAALNLVLLDVMMGPMSGFKFATSLEKNWKLNIPVIFLTAKDTENDILTGFSLGADDYISQNRFPLMNWQQE